MSTPFIINSTIYFIYFILFIKTSMKEKYNIQYYRHGIRHFALKSTS